MACVSAFVVHPSEPHLPSRLLNWGVGTACRTVPSLPWEPGTPLQHNAQPSCGVHLPFAARPQQLRKRGTTLAKRRHRGALCSGGKRNRTATPNNHEYLTEQSQAM